MSSIEPKQPSVQSGGSAAAPSQNVVKFDKSQDLLTLFGKGYGTYQARPENYVLSFISHTVILGLLLWGLHVTIQPQILTPNLAHPIELTDYVMKVGKG